jgi:hypothetical protein
VARRPDVEEGLVEEPRKFVPGPRLFGEQAEE